MLTKLRGTTSEGGANPARRHTSPSHNESATGWGGASRLYIRLFADRATRDVLSHAVIDVLLRVFPRAFEVEELSSS
jgi:hypothetical protein